MVMSKFLKGEAHFMSDLIIIVKNEACVILRLKPILFANNFESLFVIIIPLPLAVVGASDGFTGAALILSATIHGGMTI